MAEKILGKVTAYIKEHDLIRAGDRIIVGLSGGADSVCLFYLLASLQEKMGFELRAVHVHHGIRPEAEQDVSYVEKTCREKGISCSVFRENVPAFAKEHGLTEEEAGRMLRYRDFRKALAQWEEEETEGRHMSTGERRGQERMACRYRVAVAHHLDDQAETVLFQLFRGSGLAGLRGMLPARENIIRPILCLSRKEIEEYLREKGIFWCEDRTNASEEYSRNKIRHKILPYAEKEICEGAAGHIGKAAEILQEAERYIRKQTKEAFVRTASKWQGAYIVFDIPKFLKEDVFLQKQLLLYGLELVTNARKDIGAIHVEDLWKLVRKQGNGELSLPGEMIARKSYQKLFIMPKEERAGESDIQDMFMQDKGFLYGEAEPGTETELLYLPEDSEQKKQFFKAIPEKTYTKWFDYDKIETPYLLRHRQNGDFLTIDGRMNHKSIKDYMIQEKIPAQVRDKIWLLADGNHIMWIPGGRISAYYRITEQTKTILQITIRNGG